MFIHQKSNDFHENMINQHLNYNDDQNFVALLYALFQINNFSKQMSKDFWLWSCPR